MKVLIAEKPSVATGAYREMLEAVEGERFSKKDGYLQGQKYVITWCVGHLVGLSMPEDYGWGWDMDVLPMIPEKWKTKVLENTKKQFNVLKGVCEKADTIIHGADAGREGELITGLAINKMGGLREKTQLRLWVNSFDLPSLKKAWKTMKPSSEYKNLKSSAMARSRADWLVGLNGTVAYSVKTGERGLSVGRVQTPTLGLIVTRDLEIENWTERFYFWVQGNWKNLKFTWFNENGTDIEKEEEAKKIVSELSGRVGELKSFEKKEKSTNPGKPFDLTELQKAANRVYGYKAADTLVYTQKLYEGKFVSYPRTDSQYIPETMKADAVKILNQVVKPDEKVMLRDTNEKFVFFNSKKVTDHYAVIPTGVPAKGLSDKEKNVYDLIRNQFVTAFMKPYLYEEYKLEVAVGNHKMKSTAKRVIDEGFKGLKAAKKEGKETEEGAADEVSNIVTSPLTFSVGDKSPLEKAEVVKKKASKPGYYTEATLLTAMGTAGRIIEDEEQREAMKERGLGTPATKASIIERIKKVGYVESKGKKIVSTPKGRALIAMVDPKLKSAEMTGEMEYKLNQMEKGAYTPKEFKGEIVTYVTELVSTIKTQDLSNFKETMTVDNHDCPKCKKEKLMQTPKLWKCTDESCGFMLWTSMAKKKLSDKNLSDLIKKGKTGTIKGFKSKAGKKFDAVVKFDGGYEAKFDF